MDTASIRQLPSGLAARLRRIQQQGLDQAPGNRPDTASQLLEAVITGESAHLVKSARIGLGPLASRGPVRGVVGQTWVYLELRCPANRNPDNFYAQWEGELLVGTLRMASHVLGLDGVRGLSMTLVYPDGTTQVGLQSVIARPLTLTTMPRQEARRTIEANLKRDHRLTDVHLRFFDAYTPAPVVTVRFAPANAFASAGDALRPVFGDATRYEGIALRVVDASGRFVRFAGVATQTGVSFRTDPK